MYLYTYIYIYFLFLRGFMALVLPLTGKCEIGPTDFQIFRFHYSRIEKMDAHADTN